MTEAELMAAVFTALDRGDALDFAAIRVVARPLAAPPRPAAPPPAAGRGTSRRRGETPAPAPVPPPTVSPSVHDPRDMSQGTHGEPAAARQAAALADLRDHLRGGPAWSAPEHPPLDRADLTPAQQGLLADAARHAPLPLLRLRGLARGDALDALHDFVTLHRAAGRRYVRVVPGKGIGSRAEPVLKASVLAWCATDGQAEVDAYAPEPDDPDGTYGALVLRLRPARRGL